MPIKLIGIGLLILAILFLLPIVFNGAVITVIGKVILGGFFLFGLLFTIS